MIANQHKMKKNRKSIYILYTGGTIGMQRSSKGYVPAPGLLIDLMQRMAEFRHPEMPLYTIHEYSPLIDSANMQPSQWQTIANDIALHYDKYDGFLILHGTDTMAYTASALSFMLGHLNKPVILTGSQVPLIETHTDARENLIMAMLIAANAKISEVCLYFHNVLLRGNRSQKVNAFSFSAFDSPNFPPLAEVGITIKYREELFLPKAAIKTPLHIPLLKKTNIAQISLFPGIHIPTLESLLDQNPQALILHTYGLGNAPAANLDLIALLENAAKKGILLINHTQCHQGTVTMQNYATGGILHELGMVSAHDMTIEAIIGKLTVLLSQEDTLAGLKEKFEKNLYGEFT